MNDQNPYAAPQAIEPRKTAPTSGGLPLASVVAIEFRFFIWGLWLLFGSLILAGIFLISGVHGIAVGISVIMLMAGSQILISTLPTKFAGSHCFRIAAAIQSALIVLAFLPESFVSQIWILRSFKLGEIFMAGEELCCVLLLLGFCLLAAQLRFRALWWTSLLGIVGLCCSLLGLHTADYWMIINPEGTAYEIILYGYILLILIVLIFLIMFAIVFLGFLIQRYAIRQREAMQQMQLGNEVRDS